MLSFCGTKNRAATYLSSAVCFIFFFSLQANQLIIQLLPVLFLCIICYYFFIRQQHSFYWKILGFL